VTSGELWIVATPIGTLADFPPRAREVLAKVDVVLAEDTRRARRLLGRLGVTPSGSLKSLHEHNEDRVLPGLLEALAAGRSLAIISDAGTPVVSDPGFKLVRAARSEGFAVYSVPGPSSFTAALAAAGQPPLPATLCGFLPSRPGPRRRRIAELATVPWTLVVLLSPHRMRAEITDLAAALGANRPATLLAEISKRFERGRMATLGELVRGHEVDAPRGEYILVIAPYQSAPRPAEVTQQAARDEYDRALGEGLARADAMRLAARRLGIRKREIFELLVTRDGNKGPGSKDSDR
jgi:16S rRNA (cytidine1402-2'-O)-methyltransferase